MAEKNFQMRRKLAGGGFDDYFPLTKATNVKMSDGVTTVEQKFINIIPVIESGSFTIANGAVSIPIGGSYSKVINLTKPGAKKGQIRIRSQYGGGAICLFTKVQTETYSWGKLKNSSYAFMNDRSVDTYAVATGFGNSTVASDIVIRDLYINASNQLVIDFYNNDSYVRNLVVESAIWEVTS